MRISFVINKIRKCKKDYVIRKGYKELYKQIGKLNPSLLQPIEGEKLWLKKWKLIDKNISVYSYRIFSRYVGQNIDLMPLETCAVLVEPNLCPVSYFDFYNDKNAFDKLFPNGFLPRTLVRNINGFYYDENYQLLNERIIDDFLIKESKVVVKPTVGGESGKGVQVFTKYDGIWKNKKGDVISKDYLELNYQENFIVQEYLQQSQFMNSLNNSSVNTIRIMTYRSVINDEIFIPNAILRVGASGEEVDNAHHGGMFCGISDNGTLGKYMCNFLGIKKTVFNGVDYEKNNFVIPNYEQVINFAKRTARQVIHHRLLALDIMMDINNQPHLIEINVGGFSAWLFQFTTGSVFKEFTNEIVKYCLQKE